MNMKFTGYSISLSFSPLTSNFIKNTPRFQATISRRSPRNLCISSFFCSKQQSNDKHGPVPNHYLPPWFSVAPMMDWTDNHYRTLARLISKHAWLYTEMLAAETIVHQKDNLDRFLAYSPQQNPIVLQIGGSNVESLAKATELANAYCYDEINLNCGCPSPRVAGHGSFGVRLMLDPKKSLLPRLCQQLLQVQMYLSVSNVELAWMIMILTMNCVISYSSPAENRSIPPLKYEYFYGLLRDFPDLTFTINGGIASVDEVIAAREAGAHGVMIGRAAFYNPWNVLGHVDTAIYGAPSCGLTRRQVLEKYIVYGDSVLGKYGHKPTVRDVVKPLLNLFHSAPGNGQWKRNADAAFRNCTTITSFFEETLEAIPDSVLDSPVTEPSPSRTDLFANVDSLLPPPYRTSEEAIVICA
ncbi:unnamed protein product [Vicia faba]|uniref:DUS-like FMN-binding domain-containing protein n=1 Tax=Vicia faba TaxID=3906 RepID=A0AAV1AQH3_VICFA|nr:unnamed protein product [Vicia faba]